MKKKTMQANIKSKFLNPKMPIHSKAVINFLNSRVKAGVEFLLNKIHIYIPCAALLNILKSWTHFNKYSYVCCSCVG